jgi:hypothetical protein
MGDIIIINLFLTLVFMDILNWESLIVEFQDCVILLNI